mmetsp:Transcript_23515/g.34829  ORF Transcript_23515/g.34829 Transcript_23515/m.34829 type:complete len:635 (-) Transcript_23515:41-1945(-)
MSRRRGEFEHRTSIFEGAYRAWSHLGGVDPMNLTSDTAADLDPLTHPHLDDTRVPELDHNKFPYEPLPRAGLAHPFVQAIISPWLGPDAEHDDIILGLTTLRTWWQHRRKGESISARAALGTDKMMSVVEGYTRHFFNVAHCIVMEDGEQPPRTLANKIKELEKNGIKLTSMKKKSIAGTKCFIQPKDQQILESEAINNTEEGAQKIVAEMSCCTVPEGAVSNNEQSAAISPFHDDRRYYGDPDKSPVVFVSEKGDIQIAMSLSGITCGNCVKIIETVLKGVNGSPSPIQGILDAAADRDLAMAIIKIEKSSFAKRIAYEATNVLKMVGYDARPKEMGIIDPNSGASMDLNALRTAFDIVAATDAKDVFDWKLMCLCPDNGILRVDCPRHNQMNTRFFEAFDERQRQIQEFMGGCGKKYGLPCTCGENCKCNSGKCCGPAATAGNDIVPGVQNSVGTSKQTNVSAGTNVQKAPVGATYPPQAPLYTMNGGMAIPSSAPQSISTAGMIPQAQHIQTHAMANQFYHHQSQTMSQHHHQSQAMLQHHHQSHAQPPNIGIESVTQSTLGQPVMAQHMSQPNMAMQMYPVGNYGNGQYIPHQPMMMYPPPPSSQQQQHSNPNGLMSGGNTQQESFWKPS